MHFAAALALALTSITSLAAAAVIDSQFIPADARAFAAANATLARRSGCGSVGPLGEGHFKWFITESCTPGQAMICQATDASGCVPGTASKIGSMEVDNPDDTQNFAHAKFTNTVSFTCPVGGQIRCEANFNDNNDGPNYSLRVFNA